MGLSKIMFAVRAKPGLTRAEALDHLANRHAPLVAASVTVRARMRTYIQNRAVDAPGVPDQTSDRDWIVEGWRDMTVAIPEPPVAADAIALREDEARFPDRATLLALAVDQQDMAIEPSGNRGAIKLFTYFRRAPDAGDDWAGAWEAAAQKLAAAPAFAQRCRRIERNVARAGEGQSKRADAGPSAPVVPDYDGVDVWRFAAIADIEALFADPEARMAITDYERFLDPASRFRFVAEEHVIFDDAGVTH